MTTLGQTEAVDLSQLNRALERANLPALLAVLYQLTGDRTWLGEQFRPTRAKGMDENRDGGLDERTQATVREAAGVAIRRWADGKAPALPEVTGTELIEVLSFVNGEEVPDEYE